MGKSNSIISIAYCFSLFSVFLDVLNFVNARAGFGFGWLVPAGKLCILAMAFRMIASSKKSMIFVCMIAIFGLVRIFSIAIASEPIYQQDFEFLFRLLLTAAFIESLLKVQNKVVRELNYAAFVLLLFEGLSILMAFIFRIDFFQAYETRDGYKGLFVHTNDEAFLLAAGIIWCIDGWLREKEVRYLVLAGILSGGSLIMGMGSRTALLGVGIGTGLYLLLTIILKLKKFPLRLLFVIGAFASGSALGIWSFWERIQTSIIDQLVRVYFESNGSLITALTSGRDEKIQQLFVGMQSIRGILFGASIRLDQLPSQMMESDVFDLIFRLGPIGFCLISILAIQRWMKYLKSSDHVGLIAFVCLVAIVGGLTGHVLISSQNSFWVGFFVVSFRARGYVKNSVIVKRLGNNERINCSAAN